jgi:hypothetical protein
MIYVFSKTFRPASANPSAFPVGTGVTSSVVKAART